MSETEVHKGKLVPLVLFGVTIEERCKSACEKLNIEPTSAHETWEEALRDRGYGKIYIRDRVIYEIHDEELDACGFSIVDENKDGYIHQEAQCVDCGFTWFD